MNIADIGDLQLALGDIPASLQLIEQQVAGLAHLIALGGEHGITLPLLRALSRRVHGHLALVHFDAHVDTWPDNFGQTLRARLGLLPRHRGTTDRAATHDPDRHSLAGAARSLGLDDRPGRHGADRAGRARDGRRRGGTADSHRGRRDARPISASTWTRSIRPSHRAPGRRRSAAWRHGRFRRSCVACAASGSPAWMSWRFHQPTTSRKSPRSQRPPSPGSIWRWSGPAENLSRLWERACPDLIRVGAKRRVGVNPCPTDCLAINHRMPPHPP